MQLLMSAGMQAEADGWLSVGWLAAYTRYRETWKWNQKTVSRAAAVDRLSNINVFKLYICVDRIGRDLVNIAILQFTICYFF